MAGLVRVVKSPVVGAVAFVAAWSLACGGGEQAPQTPACDLSLDNLEGQTFLMYEAMPDKSYVENKRTRVKFVKEDGDLLARYTVGSLSDVIDYECTMREKGKDDDVQRTLYCAEKERATDWCQALLVAEGAKCSKKELRDLGIEKLTDDELNEAIKNAKETVKKFRGTDKWDHFVLNNNNLGNKLQGRLYVEVDEKRCRLSISDMYFTIFDGKGLEDTNPTGINPFVKTDATYLFEHCNDGRALAAIDTAERPDDWSSVSRRMEHATDKDIHYHYAGEKALKGEEGCTYSYDTWAQWEKVAEGQEAPVIADGKLKGMVDWHTSYKFSPDAPFTYNGKPVGVFHMVRYQKCGGKEREKIDTVCNASIVM